MTLYKPVYRSPINTVAQAINSACQLHDQSGAPVILIQGAVADLLAAHFAAIPDKPGQMVVVEDGLLARLTATQLYLFGRSPASSVALVTKLETSLRAAQRFAHVTDYSTGIAALHLVGPAAPDVLSKVCGLNFSSKSFPNLHVAQTSAAKIKTLIARADEAATPGYYLHVDAPSGQYFYDTVLDAAREFSP